MSDQLDLYKQWAPDTAMWTQWAKPVVFMNVTSSFGYTRKSLNEASSEWADYRKDRMLIIDLPEGNSIEEGIGAAKQGYRPVPLYNGVPAKSKGVVATDELVGALFSGGIVLESLRISRKANPAFLLDSNRLKGAKKRVGTFDNRWCVVVQDMPSANYLQNNGIEEIVVRTEVLQPDLQHLLYQYQKKGILIYICNNDYEIKFQRLEKSKSISWVNRFLILLGFTRSATGGFGMTIREVSSGSGSHRMG